MQHVKLCGWNVRRLEDQHAKIPYGFPVLPELSCQLVRLKTPTTSGRNLTAPWLPLCPNSGSVVELRLEDALSVERCS